MRHCKPGPCSSRIIPSAFLLVVILLVSAQVSLSQSTESTKKPMVSKETEPNHTALHVKLRLVETVSSAEATVGQLIPLEVVDSIQVVGKVVIAAGARARATVTTAKRRGHNNREGQLVLTIESVSRVDGKEAS